MLDTLQHRGRRKQLIDHLSSKYQFRREILEAMGRVPRHMFLEYGLDNLAYQDKPLPIEAGQTISQPFTVAMQTELLQLSKWDKVLEIGTGCAYQTAVLSELGYRVFSIERQRSLYQLAQKNLIRLDYHTPNLFLEMDLQDYPSLHHLREYLLPAEHRKFPQPCWSSLKLVGKWLYLLGMGPR